MKYSSKPKHSGKKSDKRKRLGISSFPAFLFCFLLAVGIFFQTDFQFSPEIPSLSWDLQSQADAFRDLFSDGSSSPSPEAEPLPEDSSFLMTVLDVGQGLSVLVQSDGHTLLYDGGDRNHSSFVVSYLLEQGITSLDYVVASHYDADHLNGVIGALSRFSVDTVLAPDYETDTKLFQSYLSTLDEKGLMPLHPAPGDTFSLGGASFTVLAPITIDEGDSNNNSLALRLSYGETSFLLTGDAEYQEEEDMCSQWGSALSSTVYVAGHHGSGSSTSWDLLQNTVPEYVVISCGEGNSYGHPHDTTMEKLEVMEIPVFRTDLQGTLSVSSDGQNLTWSQSPCNDYSPGKE